MNCRHKTLLASIWVLLFHVQLAGNDLHSFRQTFSFSPYSSAKTDIVNQFLLKIAEGNNKLRVYTSYAVEGSVELLAELDHGGMCRVKLRYHEIGFTGDVSYRHFSLERMLVPDRVSFRMNVYSADNTLIFSQVFTGAEIAADGFVSLATAERAWCQSGSVRLELTGIEFWYSETIFGRFDEWFASLEGYYAAMTLLEGVPDLLDGLSYDDPEQLILNEFRLCEAEQVLSQARYALFHRWLNLNNGDPEGFLPRFGELSAVADSLRRGFNRGISQIDDLFYGKATVVGEGGDHDKARELCGKALTYNPLHVPSHLMLAGYDLHGQRERAALSRMQDVVSYMFPSGLWKERSDRLAGEVLNAFFDAVNELLADRRYLDALGWLDGVEAFCVATTGLFPCPAALFELQRISHKGMFHSFMLVSERAFRNQNLSLCLTYLGSALDYQERHALFVPDRRDAEDLLHRLVNLHRKLGNTKQLSGDHDGALEHFGVIHDICQRYGFLNCGR